MIIYYSSLNKITIKNMYPVPHIDNLVDEIWGSNYFTKIDLSCG